MYLEEDNRLKMENPAFPVATPDKPDQTVEPEYAIEFENVSRHYRLHHEPKLTLQDRVVNLFKKDKSYEDFWALKNVSFKLEKGKTLGVIGKNGAGKSTLLKLATRILEPSSGTVRVNGRVSAMLELGTGFHPELSARENIFLNGAFYGFNRKQMEERYEKIVEFSELGKFIDTPVKHFSSGMYMRLGFAVAITVSPDILIIDEVLAVGDAAFGRKCHHAIEELKRQSKAMLFVSHAAGEVSRFCDEVIYLANGEIMARGTPGEVLDEYMMASIGPSYYINTRLNQSEPVIAPAKEAPVPAPARSLPAQPSATKQPGPEAVSLEESLLGVAAPAEFSDALSARFWRPAFGLNGGRNYWEFSLPATLAAEQRLNRPVPEYYLAVLNDGREPLDFELAGYKQAGGALDKAAGALRLVTMGNYRVEPCRLLLLKLEEAALEATRQIKLTSPRQFTAELVDYHPTPVEVAALPSIPVSPHHLWYFPYCDIRGNNVCRFEVFNPGEEFVDLRLTLLRDWAEPLAEFRAFRCSPHSQQTIDLKVELAGGAGERHHGEGFYGGALFHSASPVIIQRYSLQTVSPDYHLKNQ